MIDEITYPKEIDLGGLESSIVEFVRGNTTTIKKTIEKEHTASVAEIREHIFAYLKDDYPGVIKYFVEQNLIRVRGASAGTEEIQSEYNSLKDHYEKLFKNDVSKISLEDLEPNKEGLRFIYWFGTNPPPPFRAYCRDIIKNIKEKNSLILTEHKGCYTVPGDTHSAKTLSSK